MENNDSLIPETPNGPSLEDLPNEILSKICEHAIQRNVGRKWFCTSEALYNMCLVSRHFFAIAQPKLYDTVYISRENGIPFLKSILRNPALAAYVRNAAIERPWVDIADSDQVDTLQQALAATRSASHMDWYAAIHRKHGFEIAIFEVLLLILPKLRYLQIDSLFEEIMLIPGMVQRRGGSTLPSLDILCVYDDWESPTNATGKNWLRAILSASEVSKVITEDWLILRDLLDGSSVLTHILELSLTAAIFNEEEMTKLIQMCPNLQSLTYSDYGHYYEQPSDDMPPRMTAKDVVECLVPRQKTLRSLELSMSFPAIRYIVDQLPQEWMISDLRAWTKLQELNIDRYDLMPSWGVERQYADSGRNGCFDFLHGCRVERALEILERPSSPFLWKLSSSLRTLCIERGDRSLLPELERLPEFIVARDLPDLRSVSLPKWYCRGLHGGVARLKALGEELWKEHGVIFKVELKGDYTSPPHWLCWPADSVVCSQK